MVITAERPIEPTPHAVTTPREQRDPSTASMSALAMGIATINHNNPIGLSPQLAQRICIQGLEVVVQLQHQSQSNRDFRRGHGENKQKGNLSVSLLPSRPGDHKGQARGVEHHLERHEHEHQVTAYEQADQSQGEQNPCEEQPISYGYLEHFESPILASYGLPGGKRPRGPRATAWKPAPRRLHTGRTTRCRPVWGPPSPLP